MGLKDILVALYLLQVSSLSIYLIMVLSGSAAIFPELPGLALAKHCKLLVLDKSEHVLRIQHSVVLFLLLNCHKTLANHA